MPWPWMWNCGTLLFDAPDADSMGLVMDSYKTLTEAQHLCLAFLRRLRRVRLRFTEGEVSVRIQEGKQMEKNRYTNKTTLL